MADSVRESTLLIIRECLVYKIPPRTTSQGYRAADWNVEQFLWKGRLRVMSQGETCLIKLEDPETNELFATCRYDQSGNTVEPVTDSSRYFVIKIEDQGRKAFIGLGFRERNDAFDFNVALQDHMKHVRLEKEAQQREKEPAAATPKVDYSLKAGETISLSIGGKFGSLANSSSPSSTAFKPAVPLLPPPPGFRPIAPIPSSSSPVQGPSMVPWNATVEAASSQPPAATNSKPKSQNDWVAF